MNLKEICQTLSREIQKLVPCDRVAINVLQRDQNLLSVYADESRLSASAIPEGVSVRQGTASGWVVDHKEPLVCRNVLKDRRFPLTHERYKKVGLRSYVILPLAIRGKVLGVLNVGSLRPRGYGKKEVKILSSIAEILSLAIENSSLYEESRRREEMQKLLKEISQDITTLDINSLLKKVTERIRQVFKVDICDVRVKEKETWYVMGVSGVEPALLRSGTPSAALGRSSWIIKNRRPLLIPDITQPKMPDIPVGESTAQLGIHGYLGVPLFSKGGEVVGVLRAMTYEPREFSQEEVELLQQLANGAAIALENARLISHLESTNTELERSLREQHVLRELLSNIPVLELDTLLRRLTEEAASLFRAEIVWVRLLDREGRIATGAVAGDASVIRLMKVGEQGKLIGRGRWMLDHRRPLAIRDMTEDPERPYQGAVREAGLRGFLGAPLFTRQHRPLGVIFVMTRHPRQFRQREFDLIEQLAHGVAVAIENARLFEEVQKKSLELEEAFKAKSDFLNTLAHELRTPLNVIIGGAHLLEDGFFGEISQDGKRSLESIGKNAYDLVNLINEVLDLARLEAKRIPLRIGECSLPEIADELASSFAPLAREKGLDLRFKVEADIPRIKSDGSKIREVLQNLLANAIKYTDKGTVELRARLLRDAPPGKEKISLSVRDTGIGVKEPDLDRLFEPFFIGEGVDRAKYPGTGLGLSIVKRLVELLAGEIEVRSEGGKGSVFTVTLPLAHPGEP